METTNTNEGIMLGLLNKIRRIFVEPQIYAVLLEGNRELVLHLGVHYSLDEAIRAGQNKSAELGNQSVVANKATARTIMTVSLWTTMRASDTVQALLYPSALKNAELALSANSKVVKNTDLAPGGLAKLCRDSKNKLMEELIKEGNPQSVKEASDILSANEVALVINRIKESKEKSTG